MYSSNRSFVNAMNIAALFSVCQFASAADSHQHMIVQSGNPFLNKISSGWQNYIATPALAKWQELPTSYKWGIGVLGGVGATWAAWKTISSIRNVKASTFQTFTGPNQNQLPTLPPHISTLTTREQIREHIETFPCDQHGFFDFMFSKYCTDTSIPEDLYATWKHVLKGTPTRGLHLLFENHNVEPNPHYVQFLMNDGANPFERTSQINAFMRMCKCCDPEQADRLFDIMIGNCASDETKLIKKQQVLEQQREAIYAYAERSKNHVNCPTGLAWETYNYLGKKYIPNFWPISIIPAQAPRLHIYNTKSKGLSSTEASSSSSGDLRGTKLLESLKTKIAQATDCASAWRDIYKGLSSSDRKFIVSQVAFETYEQDLPTSSIAHSFALEKPALGIAMINTILDKAFSRSTQDQMWLLRMFAREAIACGCTSYLNAVINHPVFPLSGLEQSKTIYTGEETIGDLVARSGNDALKQCVAERLAFYAL